MDKTYTIPCSNCGALAVRTHFISQATKCSSCPENQVIQTECPSCDYLMVICSQSGNVIEAHASSTSVITRERNLSNSPLAIPTNVDSTKSFLASMST